MTAFPKIRDKAMKEADRNMAEEKQRLEAFLQAVAKLEAEHGCEIQARLLATDSSIRAMPHAVVIPKSEPTNAQETPTNPTKEPGQ